MKMSINNLQSIVLGREKDSGVKTIEIDCSEWKEQFPQLTKYRIEVTSPNGIIYCPEVTMNEHILTWPITKSDTALTGKGAYQIVATGENDERLTSAHLSLNIYSIMPGTAQETPPEYIESWVQNIVDTAERAELAAKKAEDAAAGIVITPEEIQNAVDNYLIENPIKAEETDPTVPGWAKAEQKPTYTAEEVGAQPKGNYALKSDIPAVPVQSVNGKTGTVVLNASDVGALPANTKIPEPYTLPVASADTLGGVKVGEGLQMIDGVLGMKPKSEYELIETITLTEDTVRIDRTTEPDGTPYKFQAVQVYGKNVGLADAKYSYGVYVNDYIVGAAGQLRAQENNFFCAAIINENGLWYRRFACQNNDAWSANQYLYAGHTRVSVGDYPYITTLTIRQLNAIPSTAGSIFEIWGVRA